MSAGPTCGGKFVGAIVMIAKCPQREHARISVWRRVRSARGRRGSVRYDRGTGQFPFLVASGEGAGESDCFVYGDVVD
jgi:hypothetical protein